MSFFIKLLILFDDIIFYIFKSRIKCENVDVLFLQHQVNYNYKYKNKHYSSLVDSLIYELIENKDYNLGFLNKPFMRLEASDLYYPAISLNSVFLFESLSNFLIKKTFGIKCSQKIRALRRFKIWENIINKCSPKIIIAIQPEPELCFVSKKNNIKIYDLQHGVISKSHKWYGETLETYEDSKLPTGILFWDRTSAENIEYWTKNRDIESVIIGHPWISRFLEDNPKDIIIQDAIKEGAVLDNQKPKILVSLQWGLHLHYYKEKSFNKIMCQSLEDTIIKSDGKYQWLLRIHPVQLQGNEKNYTLRYLNEKFGNLSFVEWHNATYLPLPVLLSKVDLHITDMSTTVTEAAWFNIPSAMLNPLLKNGKQLEHLFVYEKQIGLAELVEQKETSISAWVEQNIARKQSLDKLGSKMNSGIISFSDFISKLL